jgi:hypothetical protein
MAVGVFAGHVEFVVVMGMLDRAHPEASRGKLLDQFFNQSGLAVILPANDVHAFHQKSIGRDVKS